MEEEQQSRTSNSELKEGGGGREKGREEEEEAATLLPSFSSSSWSLLLRLFFSQGRGPECPLPSTDDDDAYLLSSCFLEFRVSVHAHGLTEDPSFPELVFEFADLPLQSFSKKSWLGRPKLRGRGSDRQNHLSLFILLHSLSLFVFLSCPGSVLFFLMTATTFLSVGAPVSSCSFFSSSYA